MAWATDTDLATFLGITTDAEVEAAIDASVAWCVRQRPDLNPYADPPADVKRAVLIYGGLLYREKASPQGFATYTEYGGDVSVADAMANVYRLLGARRPKAR